MFKICSLDILITQAIQPLANAGQAAFLLYDINLAGGLGPDQGIDR